MNEQPSYSLILEDLRDNYCRATLRYSDGRTIGYHDAWAYPGAAYQLILRVMKQYAPMLIHNGRIDSRVALNDAAARVMKKPGRKGAFLGTFTEPGEMPAVFALAAPGDVFIIYNQRTGGHHLYRITRSSRISAGINAFYHYTENLSRGSMEHAEKALFRYAKVGACCAYPPVRKFWDWTPRGLSSVRFRLKPFEWLHCSYSWYNGEGTSWKMESYHSTWGGVEQEYSHGGRDCDGRTSEHGECYADARELAAVKPNDRHDTPRPNWRYGRTECWDQYAEASNY